MNDHLPQSPSILKNRPKIILLDGSISSSLDWKNEKAHALHLISQGHQILWELDFKISKLFSDPVQFQALKLALDHFEETILKDLKENTLGIILYRGNLTFSEELLHDENQNQHFCHWLKDTFIHSIPQLKLPEIQNNPKILAFYHRDLLLDYFNLLTASFLDETKFYLFMDVSEIHDPLHLGLLVNHPKFQKYQWAMKGNRFWPSLEWNVEKLTNNNNRSFGVLLPEESCYFQKDTTPLLSMLWKLIRSQTPFRLIPEQLLLTQWDGLDHLVIQNDLVSKDGERMITGFQAAGGNILNCQKISDAAS